MQNDVNVQINWFERHLNWTAAFGLLIFPFYYYLVLNISSGWYTAIPLIDHERPVFLTVIMLVLSYSYYFLSMTAYLWVLKKKTASLFYLLFFLPAAVLTYAGVIPWWHYHVPPQPVLYQWLGYFFITLGWFFTSGTNSNPLKKDSAPETYIHRSGLNKRVFVIVSLLTVVMLVTSFFSFIYMRSVTSLYEYQSPTDDVIGKTIPSFTFEHPVSYYFLKDYFGWGIDSYFVNFASTRESGLFWEDSVSRIEITLYGLNSQDGNELSLHDEIASNSDVLYTITGPPPVFDPTPENLPPGLEFTETTVAGKPGLYLSFNRQRNDAYNTDALTGWTFFFKDSGFLWMIRLTEYGHAITEPPPPYFTRLLETFKIYDE
jgi:hypothetical protein